MFSPEGHETHAPPEAPSPTDPDELLGSAVLETKMTMTMMTMIEISYFCCYILHTQYQELRLITDTDIDQKKPYTIGQTL